MLYACDRFTLPVRVYSVVGACVRGTAVATAIDEGAIPKARADKKCTHDHQSDMRDDRTVPKQQRNRKKKD
jgi:hypothetical protein